MSCAGGFDRDLRKQNADYVLPRRSGGDTPGRGNQDVEGLYAGVGPSVFITNASSAGALSGPFTQDSYNIGLGPVSLSMQLNVGSDNTWQLNIGAKLGWSIGYSHSRYDTLTKVFWSS